jgi:hypothetical protein
MDDFVVRVVEHPHAYLASARAGIFRGGEAYGHFASSRRPVTRRAPTPGCGDSSA